MLLPDVEVVPLATRFDDEAFCRAVHEVHDEGRADIPSTEPFPATVYEDWRAGELRRAGDGGVSLVACRIGDETDKAVLGATAAEPVAFVPAAFVDWTVVRRSERRRGIGRMLKAALALWAAERGIDRLDTEVTSDNMAMIAVNASVGYRPVKGLELFESSQAELASAAMPDIAEAIALLRAEWSLDFARVRRVLAGLADGATVSELVAASGLPRRDVESIVAGLDGAVLRSSRNAGPSAGRGDLDQADGRAGGRVAAVALAAGPRAGDSGDDGPPGPVPGGRVRARPAHRCCASATTTSPRWPSVRSNRRVGASRSSTSTSRSSTTSPLPPAASAFR